MATITHSHSRSRFFVWMGGLALLIALTGFAPTYWLPMLSGRSFPPILHIHGAIFVAWNALFLWQSWLVASGRTPDHRQWGLVGIAVATAMVISVLLAANAVGDLLFNFFDADGRVVNHPINERVLSMPLDKLRKVPRRVMISGGNDKVTALHAGLKLAAANVLITNEETAKALLAYKL